MLLPFRYFPYLSEEHFLPKLIVYAHNMYINWLNVSAKKLYEKLGFIVIGESKTYYIMEVLKM